MPEVHIFKFVEARGARQGNVDVKNVRGFFVIRFEKNCSIVQFWKIFLFVFQLSGLWY